MSRKYSKLYEEKVKSKTNLARNIFKLHLRNLPGILENQNKTTLAELIGICRTAWCNYLAGRMLPSFLILLQLRKYFPNFSIDGILDEIIAADEPAKKEVIEKEWVQGEKPEKDVFLENLKEMLSSVDLTNEQKETLKETLIQKLK